MNNTNNSVFNLSIMTKYDSDNKNHVNSLVLGGCSVWWYVGIKNKDMYLCEIILRDEDKASVIKTINNTFDFGCFFNDAYQESFDFVAEVHNGIKAGKTMEEAINDVICG